MSARTRACTRQEVERTVVRSHGSGDLVPVVFEPEGRVEMVPRRCVDLLRAVRRLPPKERAAFDKVLAALAA